MSNNNNLFISSVNEAIQSSITQRKILLIYLSDESPISTKFGDDFIMNNDTLKELLPRFVMLKLIKDTQEFEFFKQVFSNLKIPSVYAIQNGAILDIISQENDLTLDSFNERVNKLIRDETNANNEVNTAPPQTTATAIKKTPKKESKPIPKKYSTLKEQSAEIAAQKYREELQKQQRQAKEERERIRNLLEMDKTQRQKEAQERKLSRSQLDAAEEIENFKNVLKENIRHNQHDEDEEYLIQLKLFNGQSLKKAFKNTTTLSTVRDFINENYPEYQSTPYYFFKPIDRITYSDIDELNKSLRDLKLNRSLIIIKPSDHYGSSSLDLKKNGFKNLANQQSWFSSVKNYFFPVFSSQHPLSSSSSSAPVSDTSALIDQSEATAENINNEVSPLISEAEQSQYSTPVIRSAEPTRSSTPRPALNLGDSTNNFSINSSSIDIASIADDLPKKNDRLVYNGNQLNLEDDNK